MLNLSPKSIISTSQGKAHNWANKESNQSSCRVLPEGTSVSNILDDRDVCLFFFLSMFSHFLILKRRFSLGSAGDRFWTEVKHDSKNNLRRACVISRSRTITEVHNTKPLSNNNVTKLLKEIWT